MTVTDQDIGTSAEPYYEGDSLEIVIDVTEDGSAKDLSGATTEWAMAEGPGGTEALSESDTGVTSTITDDVNGEVTVTIDAGVTNDLRGTWYHELRVTDSAGKKSVVTRGTIRIQQRVNQ